MLRTCTYTCTHTCRCTVVHVHVHVHCCALQFLISHVRLCYMLSLIMVIGYFEGKPIPVTQPKLVVGGIMRPYQLEGMEWLKVQYMVLLCTYMYMYV